MIVFERHVEMKIDDDAWRVVFKMLKAEGFRPPKDAAAFEYMKLSIRDVNGLETALDRVYRKKNQIFREYASAGVRPDKIFRCILDLRFVCRSFRGPLSVPEKGIEVLPFPECLREDPWADDRLPPEATKKEPRVVRDPASDPETMRYLKEEARKEALEESENGPPDENI